MEWEFTQTAPDTWEAQSPKGRIVLWLNPAHPHYGGKPMWEMHGQGIIGYASHATLLNAMGNARRIVNYLMGTHDVFGQRLIRAA